LEDYLNERKKLTGGLGRDDADDALCLSEAFEVHNTIAQSKQRIIAPKTDIASRGKLCTALAYDDAPCRHTFPPKSLHAEPLGIAVPPVS
jgi:hypothetical protein